MRKFYDDEAELGSDNEENDDVRKNIDRYGDEEENEDGLDDDLNGFVVHGDDEDEIEDASDERMLKYQRDMEALDREQTKRTMEAVIFGINNKKRKRGEVDGLEDDLGRRKMRMIEERLKMRQENPDEEFDAEDIILAAAEERDREEAEQIESKRRELQEEEEMSEEEVQK